MEKHMAQDEKIATMSSKSSDKKVTEEIRGRIDNGTSELVNAD